MQINSVKDKDFDIYKAYVTSFLAQWNVFNFYFNDDASVSVIGGLSIMNSELIKQTGKLPFKFDTIDGFMEINHCGLTTLENAPKKVTGMFSCRNNKLTNLKGCPEHLESLYCSHNALETLDGCATSLRNLDVSHNPLQNLKGIATTITGALDLSHCSLTSLAGSENTSCKELDLSNQFLNGNIASIDLSSFPKKVGKLYCMHAGLSKNDLMLLPDDILENTNIMGDFTKDDLRHALEMKKLNEKLQVNLPENQIAKRNKL